MHGVVSKYGMQHALGDCYCDDWAIEAGKRKRWFGSLRETHRLLFLANVQLRCSIAREYLTLNVSKCEVII